MLLVGFCWCLYFSQPSFDYEMQHLHWILAKILLRFKPVRCVACMSHAFLHCWKQALQRRMVWFPPLCSHPVHPPALHCWLNWLLYFSLLQWVMLGQHFLPLAGCVVSTFSAALGFVVFCSKTQFFCLVQTEKNHLVLHSHDSPAGGPWGAVDLFICDHYTIQI